MRPEYIRWPLLAALFILILNAYWWHFDRRLTEIEARSAFLDETGRWTSSQRQALATRARAFREQWGLRVLVHARVETLQLPELKGVTLFIGVNPGKGQAIVALTGLAAQALTNASREAGYDLRFKLERDLLTCARNTPSSAPCVMAALDEISALFSAR